MRGSGDNSRSGRRAHHRRSRSRSHSATEAHPPLWQVLFGSRRRSRTQLGDRNERHERSGDRPSNTRLRSNSAATVLQTNTPTTPGFSNASANFSNPGTAPTQVQPPWETRSAPTRASASRPNWRWPWSDRVQSRSKTSVEPTAASQTPTNSPIDLRSRRRQRQGNSRLSETRLNPPQPTRSPLREPWLRSQSLSDRPPEPRRPRKRSTSILIYATRILIASIGIGVLAGSILSGDPAARMAMNSQQAVAKNETQSPQQTAIAQLNTPGTEITALKSEIQGLAVKMPQFAPGIFILDMENNAHLNLRGDTVFSAASTIKVPILIAFFQDVDAGRIRLDESLTLRPELIAKEAGDLQDLPPGTKISALETATKMITISDNTATNMIIDRLGGTAQLNERFKSWGLASTVLNAPLPDLQGTNLTSAKELAILLARVTQGDLISLRSRDRVLGIMQQTITDSMLPRGLGQGATIAHKTGTLATMTGDVGLVDLPNGKRYIISTLVKRPPQNEQSEELIRQISRSAYQYFNQTPPIPNSVPSPSPSSSPSPSPSPKP